MYDHPEAGLAGLLAAITLAQLMLPPAGSAATALAVGKAAAGLGFLGGAVWARCRTLAALPSSSGHWVAAVSPDILAECAACARLTLAAMAALVLAPSLALAAAGLASDSLGSALVLANGLLAALGAAFCLSPPELWSPVMATALVRQRHASIAALAGLRPALLRWLVALAVLNALAVACRLAGVGAEALAYVAWALVAILATFSARVARAASLRTSLPALVRWARSAAPPRLALGGKALDAAAASLADAGVAEQRRLVAACLAFNLSLSARGAFAQYPYPAAAMLLLWALRSALAAAWAMLHDAPCTLAHLVRAPGGPGFGLLLDAADLRTAVDCYLAGRRWGRPVRRYRCSLPRLRHALAMSYVPQTGRGRGVASDLRLHMTLWQLAALSNAAARSGATYVWAAAWCAPPESGPLRDQLLMRVMGAMCGAGRAVAILSAQPEGGRFFQTAPCVQQYCCASMLTVVTEPRAETEEAARGSPFLSDEAQIFKMLRCYVQEHLREGSPFWLHGATGISRREGPAILQLQQILFRSMPTTPAEDKLALFVPMLWHTPVSGRAELLQLTQALADDYKPMMEHHAAALQAPANANASEAWLLQMGAHPEQLRFSSAAAGRTM